MKKRVRLEKSTEYYTECLETLQTICDELVTKDGRTVTIDLAEEPTIATNPDDPSSAWIEAWVKIPFGEARDKKYEYRQLMSLYPELHEFDANTGERALLHACLEFISALQVRSELKSPVIIGNYLMKIMDRPEMAGFLLMEYVKDCSR